MDNVVHYSDFIYAYPVGPDKLKIRIRLKTGVYDKVLLYYKNLYDHSPAIRKKNMSPLLDDSVYTMYEAMITLKERHFKYYFKLGQHGAYVCFTADGFMRRPEAVNYFYYPVINTDDVFNLPKWAEGEIIYQVLIDRFCDGDKRNNPPDTQPAHIRPDRNTYYGGDFAGLAKKLDYIKSLGTKIIYVSPLFLSPTYHKYDVLDYYKIEPAYGGEDDLIMFIKSAHRAGMRVILDCVFNHCSAEHEFFQDVIKYGAASKYKHWFYIESFPVSVEKADYDSFAGLVPSMPRFNTTNPEVIEYLSDVAAYWTRRLDIDGWRLDVADEVAVSFWREFRRKVKAVKADALIIGEVWNHGTKWMQGDQFDTITNYKYRKWLCDFALGTLDAKALWQRLQSNKMLYKTPSFNYLVNLIGSHDTIRFRTLAGEDDLHYLTLSFMLMTDGMPLIYYGDEFAMAGDVDPDNRRAVQWDKIAFEGLALIQAVGTLRSKCPTLKKGEIIPIETGPRLLAFYRRYKNDKMILVFNFNKNGTKIHIHFREILFSHKFQKHDNYVNSYGLVIGR